MNYNRQPIDKLDTSNPPATMKEKQEKDTARIMIDCLNEDIIRKRSLKFVAEKVEGSEYLTTKRGDIVEWLVEFTELQKRMRDEQAELQKRFIEAKNQNANDYLEQAKNFLKNRRREIESPIGQDIMAKIMVDFANQSEIPNSSNNSSSSKSEPILIKAGSDLIRLGPDCKYPPQADCRVVAESYYQELIHKSKIEDLIQEWESSLPSHRMHYSDADYEVADCINALKNLLSKQ